jgi:hypothetical protein
MNQTLGSIFQSLDMNFQNGLASNECENLTTFQHFFFSQVKEKIGVDAVFFLRDSEGVPKIPLIYFSAMDIYDAHKIAELHRLAWNTGEAPLLLWFYLISYWCIIIIGSHIVMRMDPMMIKLVLLNKSRLSTTWKHNEGY